jgi:hypothetical protein
MKKSDIDDASHIAVGKLMAVFDYNCAHLDNHVFEGVKIDLDNLKFPPKPTVPVVTPPLLPPPPLDQKLDPALRGHFILNFFKDTRAKIWNKAKTLGSLSTIPGPSAHDFWDIDFDDWLKNERDYSPLDPYDSKPAFKHEMADHTAGKHTEFDEALKKELMKTADYLLDQYDDNLNYANIIAYLKDDCGLNLTCTGVDEEDIGLFHIYDDASANPTSKIWEETTNFLIGIPHAHQKRSRQMHLIQKRKQAFIEMIFTQEDSTGNLQFISQSARISTTMLLRWPWLADIPLIKHLFI